MANMFTFPKTEMYEGKSLNVIQTSQFKASVEQAQRIINAYDSITVNDFWVQKTTSKDKSYYLYNALCMKHDAFVRLNDVLPIDKRFHFQYADSEPSLVRFSGGGKEIELWIMFYRDERDGMLTVAEIAADNCKGKYPMAILYKRLFDKVVKQKAGMYNVGTDADVNEATEDESTSGFVIPATERYKGADYKVVLSEHFVADIEFAKAIVSKYPIITPDDFWLNKSDYNKDGTVTYNFLCIKHDALVRLNDTLDESLRFSFSYCDPVPTVREVFGQPIWSWTYRDERDGMSEVAEVSALTCKNGYPFSMLTKRLFDRVVKRKAKLYGIYSDVEMVGTDVSAAEAAASPAAVSKRKSNNDKAVKYVIEAPANISLEYQFTGKDGTSTYTLRDALNRCKFVKDAMLKFCSSVAKNGLTDADKEMAVRIATALQVGKLTWHAQEDNGASTPLPPDEEYVIESKTDIPLGYLFTTEDGKSTYTIAQSFAQCEWNKDSILAKYRALVQNSTKPEDKDIATKIGVAVKTGELTWHRKSV